MEIWELRLEADALDRKWIIESQIKAEQKLNQAREVRPSTPYFTRVKGIKMKFIVDKKRGGKHWYTPVFIVQGSHNNVRYVKTFRILKWGFKKAWEQSVQYYCGKKGIHKIGPLLSRAPDVRQFAIIYRYQTGRGWKIPLEKMPAELLRDTYFCRKHDLQPVRKTYK